jgi:N6-adenosine-specific RNA methylase IME4
MNSKIGRQAVTPFRVVVADPPWSFNDKLPGDSRGAEKNYSVMTQSDIENFLRVQAFSVAPDAVLFCWRVSSQVEEAYRVVRAWGFVPKSEIVWRKLTKTGKEHFGMGRIVRASHETCIIAKRGKIDPAVRNIRSTFEAPTGIHSEKPAEFFRIVESLFPGGPYLELFARQPRPGWTCVGDEVDEVGEMKEVRSTSLLEMAEELAEDDVLGVEAPQRP